MIKLLLVLTIAACAGNSFAYYQAQQGRWVSRDPLGEKVTLEKQLKQAKTHERKKELIAAAFQPTYLFVENNPIGYIDLHGLFVGDPTMASYSISSGYAGRNIEAVSSMPISNGPLFGGGELHVGGGWGLTVVSCCDENDNKTHSYTFNKACVGLQLGASATGGTVQGISTCTKDAVLEQYSGRFIELSVSWAIFTGGVDLGIHDNGVFSGVWEAGGGIGVGAPVGASVCNYTFVSESIGDCCKK